MTINIQPSDTFPGVTSLELSPDIPGYQYVEFIGGAPLKVSTPADGTDDEIKAQVLATLSLSEAL